MAPIQFMTSKRRTILMPSCARARLEGSLFWRTPARQKNPKRSQFLYFSVICIDSKGHLRTLATPHYKAVDRQDDPLNCKRRTTPERALTAEAARTCGAAPKVRKANEPQAPGRAIGTTGRILAIKLHPDRAVRSSFPSTQGTGP
jgi:hypothetical protein